MPVFNLFIKFVKPEEKLGVNGLVVHIRIDSLTYIKLS